MTSGKTWMSLWVSPKDISCARRIAPRRFAGLAGVIGAITLGSVPSAVAQVTPNPPSTPAPAVMDTTPPIAGPAMPLPSVDTTTAAAGARPITLEQAIALARQNSPNTIAARGGVRTSEATRRAAVGAFIPSLSVSAGASRPYGGRQQFTNNTGTVVTSNAGQWTYSNGFSISTDLFNPQNIPNLSAARADVNAAHAAEVAQNYNVALDVATQYYGALSARESEQAAIAQLAQANEQLTASVRRVQAGAATRSDSLRSFVDVATARVALLTAHTNLRSADAALSRLVGSADVVTAVPEDSNDVAMINHPILDSATVVQLALSGPDVKQAQAAVAAADARRSAARASYLPSIGAGYSRSGNGASRFGFGDDPYSYSGQLSVSLSYPVFNGFSREAQNVQAQVNATNAEASLRDAERNARQLGVQYWDELYTAREQMIAQEAAVVAAEEDLRVQRARYDLGMSTLVDVLTSQTQLNQARANLIGARFNLRLARVRIESLIGRDVPRGVTAPAAPGTRTP